MDRFCDQSMPEYELVAWRLDDFRQQLPERERAATARRVRRALRRRARALRSARRCKKVIPLLSIGQLAALRLERQEVGAQIESELAVRGMFGATLQAGGVQLRERKASDLRALADRVITGLRSLRARHKACRRADERRVLEGQIVQTSALVGAIRDELDRRAWSLYRAAWLPTEAAPPAGGRPASIGSAAPPEQLVAWEPEELIAALGRLALISPTARGQLELPWADELPGAVAARRASGRRPKGKVPDDVLERADRLAAAIREAVAEQSLAAQRAGRADPGPGSSSLA